MAAGLHAELVAVHVDDPRRRLKPSDRERVLEHLRLAESLGAQAATIAPTSIGGDLVAEVLAFRPLRNANRIVRWPHGGRALARA
jgi:two-component system sensor histidine kinase KdpD